MREYRMPHFYKQSFERFGNTYYVNLLGRTILMTNEPENLKTILSKKFDDWPIGGPRLYAVRPILGEKSIFSSNGQDWHDARALIRPSFVRNQVADLACFDRHIGNLMDRIPKDGSTFDMKQLLQALSMDASTDFMLGYSTNLLRDVSPEARQFLHDFDTSSTNSGNRARLGPLLQKLPHPRINAAAQRMRGYLGFYLRKAVAEKKPGAADRDYVFLDVMLKSGASEAYIIDQILSVIIAGRDTTSSSLTSCFWFLSHHPNAVTQLRAEIEALGETDPSWEQLKNMKYLNNVIKEALRLASPIAANSREAARDTVLPLGGGPDGSQPILIPKGTAVRWSSFSMHRNKEVYGEDAEEFRPERWEEPRACHGRWEYTPFSGGPRICVGQQFALTQLAFTLFRVFQRFKSIQGRDDGQFRFQVALAATMPSCMVTMTPA
ncbi:cytochrome P450 [Thozetella sp. PMI_491]|nr:cytochrome P450 [Thozetella sp. PMI_491]